MIKWLSLLLIWYMIVLYESDDQLAMTAATPIYKGVLSAIDTRWSVISQSVDDRTVEELNGDHPIPKSRYDSVDLYIAKDVDPQLNDTFVPFDNQSYNTLIEHGIYS